MFTFNVKVDVVIHSGDHQAVMDALAELKSQLQVVIHKEDQLMAGQAEIDAALAKIDAATTQQGTVLAAQGATLQTISDEIDALIVAAQTGTITPAQLARLQALADSAAAVSTNLTAQAEFSKAIAAKGAGNPVPLPVPTPTPVP